MDDIMDKMFFGFDKKNEIFNLWYEINFLRLILNKILALNPSLVEKFDEECILAAREQAREIVTKRFPHCKITFNQEIPNPTDENKQEQTYCTHPDSSESPPASPPPSNEA
jgi:hypothetical protein